MMMIQSGHLEVRFWCALILFKQSQDEKGWATDLQCGAAEVAAVVLGRTAQIPMHSTNVRSHLNGMKRIAETMTRDGHVASTSYYRNANVRWGPVELRSSAVHVHTHKCFPTA